jgi:glycosyltransferase involved in cell wall biosynthesis
MTIALMLESDGPGGAEIVLFDMAQELRARGHEVVPVGPAQGVGWLGEKLRAVGFVPEIYHERRPPDLGVVRQLCEILHRRRVDVIHSHEFTMTVYGAAASWWTGIPQVVTLHGNMTMTDVWRRRVALRIALRRSRCVAAVSGATKVQVDRDLGLPADRISVVRNGIPVRRGTPDAVRAELGIAPDELLILAVGNLDRRKGHIHLLEALAQLEEEGLSRRWQVAIAGGRGGDERPRLEKFAQEHGISERVHILTHRDDIPDLQAAADVFVMPSLWEGLPLALLEALLAGTAVIASRCSGIPEAIDDGREGLLVPPGESPALADALRTLLADDRVREDLARRGQERAQREFTVGVMIDAYEAIYRAAAGGVRSAA